MKPAKVLEMRKRSVAIGAKAAAMLLALALSGCGGESPASPPLSASPSLEAQAAEGGVCVRPPPPSECAGDREDHCCFSTATCSYPTTCLPDDEMCENFACVARPIKCGNDGDCADAGGTGAIDGFVCSGSGVCIPRGCTADSGCGEGQRCIDRVCFCTSNLGCDAGQVCSGADDAGLCGPAIGDEGDPGCSASPEGASRGLALGAVSALLVAGALARRRRSE
jgi:MYXO-CTERM domain-containing protein